MFSYQGMHYVGMPGERSLDTNSVPPLPLSFGLLITLLDPAHLALFCTP